VGVLLQPALPYVAHVVASATAFTAALGATQVGPHAIALSRGEGTSIARQWAQPWPGLKTLMGVPKLCGTRTVLFYVNTYPNQHVLFSWSCLSTISLPKGHSNRGYPLTSRDWPHRPQEWHWWQSTCPAAPVAMLHKEQIGNNFSVARHCCLFSTTYVTIIITITWFQSSD
jgi:hypothetical protein